MPRGIRRYSLLSGVALCALLSGPIAIAQASNNTLLATVNSYGPRILKDENAVKVGLNVDYPQGKVRPLVRALTTEIRDLRALKFKLAHDSASSAQGTTARNEIVKGLGLIANAYGGLRRVVQAANGRSVPATKVDPLVKMDKKGVKLLKAGLKLLAHAG